MTAKKKPAQARAAGGAVGVRSMRFKTALCLAVIWSYAVCLLDHGVTTIAYEDAERPLVRRSRSAFLARTITTIQEMVKCIVALDVMRAAH